MNSSSVGSKHYGISAVKKSFAHFVLGKGFSAGASLSILFLIVRELSVAEFAVYTSLHAMVLVIGLLSSFGINPVVHRFLPELRTHNNNIAMYRLLVSGLVLRAAFYGIVVFILLPFVSPIADVFKLTDWSWLVPWYFVVGFLRTNATFMSQALESLLWQRDAQYSLAAGGLVKLAGVLAVMALSELTLPVFVLIECLGELFSLLLLITFLSIRWRNDEDREQGDAESLRRDKDRYVRFGFWCYMQNLTSILYGSAPNRLFASYFLSTEHVALFGVVDRLIDFVGRYEPLRLFIGLIRPVMMSRYAQDNDFDRLMEMANLIFRINLIILIVPMVLFAVAGNSLFEWMTAGKYGEAAKLFLGFYVVVLVVSVSNLLDVLVKAVEKNRIYLLSNIALSGSIGIAIPLISYIGLWSIAVANMIGSLVSIAIIVGYLTRYGYSYTFPWGKTSVIVVYYMLSVLAGHLMLWAGSPVFVAASLACIVYVAFIFIKPPLGGEEKRQIGKIVPEKIRRFLIAGSR